MNKKLISSVLIIALMNLVGCYSLQTVTVPEYKQIEKNEGKPDEIFVNTIYGQEYYFTDSNFYFENDSLCGKGILLTSEEDLLFEGKIALNRIESFKMELYDQTKTTWMIIGGVAYLLLGILIIAGINSFGEVK
jgi:hypothetical protein